MSNPAETRVLLVITRGERGGAQVHVRDLLTGLRAPVRFLLVVGDDEWLAAEARSLGVEVVVLPTLQRSVSPVADARTVRSLRALIEGFRPHFVHTHSTKAGMLGRVAGWSMGLPTLHTAHAWSFSDGQPPSRLLFAIPSEAAAGRITTRFMVVSEADREVALRRRVARAEQVTVVHNGVPDVSERAKPGEAGTCVITMVARMAAPKDHAGLFRALAGVTQPFRLRLVGDGPDRSGLASLARSLGLAERVDWVGVSGEIPRILSESHAFVLASRQEGFPLSILEAMRAGLPVVASDVGGIREAVVHGQSGLLVDRCDDLSLRTSLCGLISDPARRRAMGEAGRARYVERFTVEQMLNQTVSVYESLAVGRPA